MEWAKKTRNGDTITHTRNKAAWGDAYGGVEVGNVEEDEESLDGMEIAEMTELLDGDMRLDTLS